MTVFELRIADIAVGERRREDYGDLDELAASIEKYDLLHPVVVDEANNLVAGGRRLEACKLLGWTAVPIRRLGDLTYIERREIELEENLRRKDLSPLERSKVMVGLAATASEVLRQQEADFWSDSDQKSAGRPKKVDAKSRVAERIGVSKAGLIDAEQHVETVEQHLPTAARDWPQYHVLEARTHLDRLPDEDRARAAKLIDQPGIPPSEALPVLKNLAAMPDEERRSVLTLAESPDERDRSLALTTAAQKPPMPDPRLVRLDRAADELRAAFKPFADDPLTPRIRAAMDEVKAIAREIREGGRNGHA